MDDLIHITDVSTIHAEEIAENLLLGLKTFILEHLVESGNAAGLKGIGAIIDNHLILRC